MEGVANIDVGTCCTRSNVPYIATFNTPLGKIPELAAPEYILQKPLRRPHTAPWPGRPSHPASLQICSSARGAYRTVFPAVYSLLANMIHRECLSSTHHSARNKCLQIIFLILVPFQNFLCRARFFLYDTISLPDASATF